MKKPRVPEKGTAGFALWINHLYATGHRANLRTQAAADACLLVDNGNAIPAKTYRLVTAIPAGDIADPTPDAHACVDAGEHRDAMGNFLVHHQVLESATDKF